ncbi:MAG: hypothetical protein AAGI49_11365, partial [Bacteroidota bacterium]
MDKTRTYEITKNAAYGYYEIANKPDEQSLNDYYAQKYYQPNAEKVNQYQSKYSQIDLNYIQQKIAQKHHFAQEHYTKDHFQTAIDLGCGEGHAVAYLL